MFETMNKMVLYQFGITFCDFQEKH
jgi:hypothetical protein